MRSPRPFGRPARFSSGVVVVDAATAGLARELVEFEKLGTISVKGKAVQVEVYTPLGPALASVRAIPWRAWRRTTPSVCGQAVGCSSME